MRCPRPESRKSRFGADSAIDQYSDAVAKAVEDARNDGLDWYLFEVAGLLDRLAARRYIDDSQARPLWWRRYELPPELKALSPEPDSHFFVAGPEGRVQEGSSRSTECTRPPSATGYWPRN